MKPVRMVRVQVLVGWSLGAGKDVYPGDEAIIPEWEARARVAQGTALLLPDLEPPKEPEAAVPEEAPPAEPDPPPTRGGSRRR